MSPHHPRAPLLIPKTEGQLRRLGAHPIEDGPPNVRPVSGLHGINYEIELTENGKRRLLEFEDRHELRKNAMRKPLATVWAWLRGEP